MDTLPFFSYARERHAIYLRRQAGHPKPWTDDPVLRTSRFTNVFRELDRTTVWFREHVRDPLRHTQEVVLATVVFRWFNRITTGEAIFCQVGTDGLTAFERLLETNDASVLRAPILAFNGEKGPHVTGAYIINTRSAGLGLSKLDGVLKLLDMWLETHEWAEWRGSLTLQDAAGWVQGPCMGGFMAYEVVSDLRWTSILDRAPDVDTWANPGPGAVRGLNRIHGREPGRSIRQEDAIEDMRKILVASRFEHNWPQHWKQWELREVEHTLCEFDKYERVRAGEGQTRGRYDGG